MSAKQQQLDPAAWSGRGKLSFPAAGQAQVPDPLEALLGVHEEFVLKRDREGERVTKGCRSLGVVAGWRLWWSLWR